MAWWQLPLLLCRWSGSFSALFWPFWEWTEMFVSRVIRRVGEANCIVFQLFKAAFQGLKPNSDRLTLKIVKRDLRRNSAQFMSGHEIWRHTEIGISIFCPGFTTLLKKITRCWQRKRSGVECEATRILIVLAPRQRQNKLDHVVLALLLWSRETAFCDGTKKFYELRYEAIFE